MSNARMTNSAERLKTRYLNARHTLRRNVRNISKDDQVEACHVIKRIEDFGFYFFPDHYIRDDVVRLERLAGRDH